MWKLYISRWILVLEFSSLGDQNAENTSHPCPVGKSWSATLNHIKGQRNFYLAMFTSYTAGEKKKRDKNERSQR